MEASRAMLNLRTAKEVGEEMADMNLTLHVANRCWEKLRAGADNPVEQRMLLCEFEAKLKTGLELLDKISEAGKLETPANHANGTVKVGATA